MSTTSTFDFSAVNLIRFLWRNKWPILLITFFAGITSIVVSLSITPKFKSAVVFYPTVNQSVSSALFSKSSARKSDAMDFGGEEDVEQFLQILRSDFIKERIIQKYDLLNHYGIDLSSGEKYLNLNEEYDKNIKYRKTQYMSIEVSVMDTDPDTAAFIARDIVAYMDTAFTTMKRDVALKSLQIIENEYHALRKDIKALEDTLKFIRSNGVYDVENQVGPLSEAYWQASSKGQTEQAKNVKKELEKLAKYGGNYQSLLVLLEKMNENLADIKQNYAEAKVNVEQVLPHKFIVNNAYPAEKKSYPIRSLIVVVSTLSAFFFALFLMVVIEAVKQAFKAEE